MSVVGSKIVAVKVYHVGASVKRRFEVAAESGRLPEDVEIAELPLALADVSVRVRVVTPLNAELEAASVRVGLYVAPKRDLPSEPDREEKKKIDRQLELLEASMRRRDYEMALLGGMEVPDRPQGEEGKPPPASPMAARIALEEFVDEAVRARILERRAFETELESLRKRSAELAQRIAAASNAHTAEAREVTKSVSVRLRQGATSIARAELELEYFIPGARWAPSYQCRLSRDALQAEIVMRALVAQSSGEDWRGVRIQLSTASPLSWTELPELASVRIGKTQPATAMRRGYRKPPQGAGGLFEDYDRERRRAESLLPPGSGFLPPMLSLLPPGSWEHAAAMPSPRAVTEIAEVEDDPTVDGARAMQFGGRGTGAGVMLALREESNDAPMMDYSSADTGEMAIEKLVERPKKRPPAPRSSLRQTSMVSTVEAYAFHQLRLSAPDDGAFRGHLRAVDMRTAYAESLARLSVEVKVDVLAIVEAAQRRAQATSSLALPKEASDVRGAAGHFDFAYEADAPVDVASDGAWHSIPVGVRASECAMKYIVVPREDTSVFRSAQLKNPLAAPLLPGAAEIYVGGEYVLTTRIPTVTPHGEFELGLGVEQAIKCARNTRFEEKRSGSKVVATNELWHDIEIALANNLDREVKCEIRERIPQPHADAEVVVEEGAIEPPWEAYDQEDRSRLIEGGRRWNIAIPAHEEKKVRAQYVVKIYANNELAGGNRREA